MYFIVVKFSVKPEQTDSWPETVAAFTEATRTEPGNLWFDWSRSIDDPHQYVLVEAFTDEGAGPHVNSDHFQQMTKEFPHYLQQTPDIISRQIDGDGWDKMGEVQVD